MAPLSVGAFGRHAPGRYLWDGQEFGQFSFDGVRRLVALKPPLPSSCASFINKRRFYRQISRSALHVTQEVRPPHDDLRPADDQNILVVQPLEADGHPLPGGG